MKERDRFYEIDLLRFIAALSVVLFHYTYRGWSWDKLSDVAFPEFGFLFKYGYLGVDLFFIISGFVILLTASGRTATQFVISRAVRLYPAYWIGVLFTAGVIAVWSDSRFQVSWSQIAANMTMLHHFAGIGHVDNVYWSLVVELKFYFLVFILVILGQLKNLIFFLYFWILATIYMVFFGPIYKVSFFLFPDWAGYFIAGASFYLIYQERKLRPKHALLLILSYISVLQAAHTRTLDATSIGATEETMLVTGIFVTCAFALFLAIALRHTASRSRPWFRTAGALTYPLYLVHQNAGYVFFNTTAGTLNRFVALAAALAIAIGLAWMISAWIEKPLAPRLKRLLQASAYRIGQARTRD